MKKFAIRLLTAYGSAIILMFFSEFYFLNESPVHDLISGIKSIPVAAIFGLAELSLYYMLFAYPFLALLSAYHVRSLPGLLLAGAVFGWLTEAVVVPVVYEAIPTSFVFPSISWHALIDVILGWYLLRMSMRKLGIVLNAAIFAALGAIWGSWATWYWPGTEDFPAIVPGDFVIFVFTTSGYWLVGMIVSDKAGQPEFSASKRELATVGLATAVFFASMAFPFLPLSLALLPLIGITIFALYIGRYGQKGVPILERLHRRAPRWQIYPTVLLTPVTASLVYPLFYNNQQQVPIDLIVPNLLILGATSFLYALIRVFWQGARSENPGA